MARKTRMGELTAHEATTAISTFKSHFQTQYQIVRMTTEIVERAMELAEQHRLRSYDATQLASALMGKTVLLWAGKRPLPYSHRRPTLFQPMHADIDIIGSI